MKLPVKLLSAFMALALVVVGVAANNASTSSAAVGQLFVANEGTSRTNQNPAPGGFTFVGSGNDVYVTYEPAAGQFRVIRSNSDLVRVTVIDAGQDFTSAASDTTPSPLDISGTLVGGSEVVVTLTGQATIPIAGNLAFVQANTEVLNAAAGANIIGTSGGTGEFSIVAFFAGDGVNDPWIRLQRNFDDGVPDPTAIEVHYLTATPGDLVGDAGGVLLDVITDLEPGGTNLFVTETGPGTGIFQGFFRLVPTDGTTADATSAASGDAATIRAGSGAATVRYTDTDNVQRTTLVRIDTVAPSITVNGPANGLATQDARPSFTGTINESGAGLNMTAFNVIGATGDGLVVPTAIDSNPFSAAGVQLFDPRNVSKTGAVDGQSSFAYSWTPASDLPEGNIRWQVRSSDLAGNVGFSDSDGNPTAGITDGGRTPVETVFDSHTVRIDTTPPNFSGTLADHRTGRTLEAITNADIADSTRRTVLVTFDESVQTPPASSFRVTLSTDGSQHTPVAVLHFGNRVYLQLATAIPSADKPTVVLQGGVADLAGNTRSSGSTPVRDGIAPVLTSTLSGGTGTGTGAEASNRLTRTNMVVTVTSDEQLTTPPVLTVHHLDGAGASTGSFGVAMLSQGDRIWAGTVTSAAMATPGNKAVVITGTDVETVPGGNTRTLGGTSPNFTQTFRFDNALTAPNITPADASSTSQRRPFIRLDFAGGGEVSSVTMMEITLNGTNVASSLVASANNREFFLVPGADLPLGDNVVVIPINGARDAAGNMNPTAITTTFSVIDRVAFSLQLFAGWNAKSFPSNPVDPAIGSVFTNTAVDQVVRFYAMDTASPWRIATRDSVSGAWTSSTPTPLNMIQSGPGYWIHTNNFAPQAVQLIGEVLPGAGSPPPVVTIPTAAGWNFVGVVSQSRTQTEGASGADLTRIDSLGATVVVTVEDYFGTVNSGRVYRYDSTQLRFVELGPADPVRIGDALWVFISPQADGSLPAIVP